MTTVQRYESGRWVTVQVPANRAELETAFYRSGMTTPVRIVRDGEVVWSLRRRTVLAKSW